jgi:Rrf2 family protein
MLKLNRKTEYALLALEHMTQKEAQAGEITSTREVSEAYHIPYPLLGKVMQKLASKGFVKAIHGTKGGYTLAKRADDISVADVVEIFDGRVAVADCFKAAKITCPQWDGCLIKDPLAEFNRKIYELLARTTVRDLLGGPEGGAGFQTKEGEQLLPAFPVSH